MSAAEVVFLPIREIFPGGKAQAKDIYNAPDVTTSERHHWSILCTYRNASNLAYPGLPRIAKDYGHGIRASQRALRGLEEKGWIGRPEGPGGSDPNKTDSFTIYHLHRDGKPCAECRAMQEKRTRVSREGAALSVMKVSGLAAREEQARRGSWLPR